MISINEAADKVGMPYSVLRTWITHGYVYISAEKIGPGKTRYFDDSEVKILEVMHRLNRAGVTASVAALAARGFPAPIRDLQLALDKAKALVAAAAAVRPPTYR